MADNVNRAALPSGTQQEPGAIAPLRRPGRDAPVRVTVMRQPGAEPSRLLEQTLERAGFWAHIDAARRSKVGPGGFRVIIKPDLDVFGSPGPGPAGIQPVAGTDPMLVEHLVDLLHDHGHADVVIGDGRNEPDAWLHNREALVVPDLVGYRFATSKGRAYDVVDLRSRVSPASPVSAHWGDADYRINFAKNRTHEDCVFALCVHNLAGLVGTASAPGNDDGPAPASRLAQRPDDCLQVLRLAPPHFNLIDAHVSSHGGAGHRAPRSMHTHAIIASPDALLADWAGAAKMGLDPYASPVNAACLRAIGLPAQHEIDGELTPWPLWRNVHPLLAHSARLRNRADGIGWVAGAWFQSIDRERFAPRDFYNDRINTFLAPLMARIDDSPRAFWIVVLLNQLIAKIDAAVLAQHTMFSKERLQRRVAPLTFDPARHRAREYAAIEAYLAPYERLLADCPCNRDGLRWRHVDGSILFSAEHVFPIAFDEFTARVDITRTIQYMNDYIGGSTTVVRRDRGGRVLHQAERNLYLQQPNWVVLFGGEVIDVEKLEAIRYGRNLQTLHWRTVSSPNGSASHDDGCVSFVRSSAGETTVRIFARQQFALPLFFQVFDVDLFPGFRDPIIENAYTAFFQGTIANLQAAFDGREFRIGQDAALSAPAAGQRDLPRYLATAVAAGAELLRHRGDLSALGQWLFSPAPGDGSPNGSDAAVHPLDADGFRHFGPSAPGSQADPSDPAQAFATGVLALTRDAPGLLVGLAEAMQLDLERLADGTPSTAPAFGPAGADQSPPPR